MSSELTIWTRKSTVGADKGTHIWTHNEFIRTEQGYNFYQV